MFVTSTPSFISITKESLKPFWYSVSHYPRDVVGLPKLQPSYNLSARLPHRKANTRWDIGLQAIIRTALRNYRVAACREQVWSLVESSPRLALILCQKLPRGSILRILPRRHVRQGYCTLSVGHGVY